MARTAHEARDLRSQELAARAAAPDTAAALQTPLETEPAAQRTAGDLLQQQLQLLTVDSQESEGVLLSQLLRACVVTVGHMAAFHPTQNATDTMWSSQGTVAGRSTPYATHLTLFS